MNLISPSLLAADFAHLADDVKKIEESGADWLHLDVMDGAFVPNISFGAPVIAALRSHTKLFFDVHLMLCQPLRYLPDFVKAGADLITFHQEAAGDPRETIQAIHDAGLQAAMAISPETPAQSLFPYLPDLQMALVMTVHPGFGGQSFMPETMPKVTALRQEADRRGLSLRIQVDGGIGPKTAPMAVRSGADVLVAGSAIFHASNPQEVITALKSIR